MDSQRKPPSDLVTVLGAHLAFNADRYGLDADALRLERFPGSAVKEARSFTVYDRDHAVHVKLWHTERQDVWEQWLAVRKVLESRYQAPRIIDIVDLPHIGMDGLVFEHIEGVTPTDGANTGALVALAHRLHADQELASKIRLFKGAATVGQCFERMHVRRWDIDISIIQDAELPSVVDEPLLGWMEGETRGLEQTVRNSVPFEVPARWPTHGDLYEGNTLITDAGDMYVLDWDDLALGDPVADYILILWSSARHDPAFDWHRLGVEATDEGFGERMRFYARATLLDEVIDGLAEYVGLDATDSVLAPTSREKYQAFESGLSLYRERYG